MPDPNKSATAARPPLSERWRTLYRRIKALQGDPHYVAMGVAIGVFVALTPTIPLHTAIALGLAFMLRASKPAAAIAVWLSNPLTIPFFYYASFKLGTLILGHELPLKGHQPTVSQLLKMGWDVTIATIVGGALLGIIPAVAAYFLTFHLFQRIHLRRQQRKLSRMQAGAHEAHIEEYQARLNRR
jgi:uncharacterized protein (DUF2062 family)